RSGEPGDVCSTVFAVGAMLYEMVTGESIGAAMRRPREIEPSLPEALEILVGKAIIGDRAHRPSDLSALTSALYHVAPRKSIHPPEVSESNIDASAQLEVDVKFLMLPPAAGGAAGPASKGQKRADDPTQQLAALKARLESDPRPRYVVNKDKMDHGPFT